MSCLSRVRMTLDEMTAVERRIAAHILSTPERVLSATAGEIALASKTSPASVVRFSRMLGYETLAEMKEALRSDVTLLRAQDVEIVLQTNDSLAEISQKILAKVQYTLGETLLLQREKDISTVVDAMLGADTIHLLGVGASSLAAIDLQKKLMRIGRRCTYHTDTDLALVGIAYATPRDVVLAFSYGGRTRQVNFAVETARSHSAYTIAVTKLGKNPLAAAADIVLPLPENEKELRVGAVHSRYAQLLLVDLLFMGMIHKQHENLPEMLEETRRLIREFRE
ncbi:MAG: MurR/RpiR family transcriptional regulator [Clostridia bacterium]